MSSELGGAAPGADSLKYLKTQGHLSWAAQLAEGLSFHIETGAGEGEGLAGSVLRCLLGFS